MLVTAMLLVILILLLLYLNCQKPKGYPPGPRWWPILGCALEIARIRQETGYLFKTCSTLCKKYGPVVGLKIGQDRIVIVNDIESIRAMLTNKDCDGRPNGPFFKARTWGVTLGLLVVDDKLWVEQRRFVIRHLRDFGFGRTSMVTIIEDEALKLVEHFKKMLKNNYETADARKIKTINNNNIGQIYKLQKDPKNKLNESEIYDEFHVLKNKIANRKLRTVADLYMKAEDYEEVRKVSQTTGMIISMHDAFGVTVLNTLWRMMAGRRYDPGDKELTHLQQILTKLLNEIDMIGAPFSQFPLLRFIAPEMSGYKAFVETHQELWAFLKDELYNHKNTFLSNAPRDLMDVYLNVLNSKDCSDTFSESQLLAICVDLFIAGSETTSKALGFGFLNLILNPQIQRKAHEEIDRVTGRKRFPTLDDKPKMPYVEAIVLESMRVFVGRTLSVPHRALKDTSIVGHKIPKDTMLVVNFNRILMDESWDDPEDFRPERFLDNNGNIITPEKYFPFGIGRHRCMGETLARSNIFIITATLLQTFNFSVVPGEPRPTTQDFVDGVTAGPKPYRALVSLRM
ncbi:PREDICTED: probable cytochrome P450 303a1 [Cyphomyrmex costatus]|uniref:probable cytochrome P450 303a1 n=1 Tax=Cyphomyrmex costatus TaxID=456900 RepID=UPI0008522594|nr:PREDICTED: probable cytochrome P450 303a1 [Cyphomyrmex costatus]